MVGSTEFIIAQSFVSAASLTSVLIAGRRRSVHRWLAWPLLVVGHGLFLFYSTVTGQWGFVPLNVGMMVAGVCNWWIASHPAPEAHASARGECPECHYVASTAVFLPNVVRGSAAAPR